MKLYDILRKTQTLPGITYLFKREAQDFRQDDLYIDHKGRYTASNKRGWRIYDKGSWQDLNGEYVDTIKVEITNEVSSIAVDTWTDIEGFTVVTDDSLTEYLTLNSDTKTIEARRSGLYMFGGHVNVQNNTTGNITATVLFRLFLNGTEEIRSSQSGKVETINSDNADSFQFSGTIYLHDKDNLRLQYYSTNADLVFNAESAFDNPIAASLWLVYIGDNV